MKVTDVDIDKIHHAGMVIMLRGENSKDVVTSVKEAIPKIQKSLPEGVNINVFYDRTSLIEACIKTVVDALVEGGIFVIFILFIFLAEFRTALIVVASLPITYLLTFPVMQWAGLTSNLMSLGGLAFSVGMVVDASIVITENIRRHLSETLDLTLRREITVQAVCEVARPVAFSILIIVVVSPGKVTEKQTPLARGRRPVRGTQFSCSVLVLFGTPGIRSILVASPSVLLVLMLPVIPGESLHVPSALALPQPPP